jgi:hypothetical protein
MSLFVALCLGKISLNKSSMIENNCLKKIGQKFNSILLKLYRIKRFLFCFSLKYDSNIILFLQS